LFGNTRIFSGNYVVASEVLPLGVVLTGEEYKMKKGILTGLKKIQD